MTDREKVVNALEHCIDGCFDNCPYEYGGAVTLKYCHSDLMRDALELLEDDETQLVYRDEIIKAHEDENERLNELLKEQEPTRVESVDYGTDMFKRYRCPKCKVFFDHNHNYCPNCGKKVKWDE